MPHVGIWIVNVGVPIVGMCVFSSLLFISLSVCDVCVRCICACVSVRMYVYVCWSVGYACACVCVISPLSVHGCVFQHYGLTYAIEPCNRRPGVMLAVDPILWRFEDPPHKAIQRSRPIRTVKT